MNIEITNQEYAEISLWANNYLAFIKSPQADLTPTTRKLLEKTTIELMQKLHDQRLKELIKT